MVKIIKIIDWAVLIQLVATIIYFLNNISGQYVKVIVYFSACLFIGYWLIRIVFAPQDDSSEPENKNGSGTEQEVKG